MKKILLRPMSDLEFDSWQTYSRKNYAEEKEKEGLSKKDALAEAEQSFSRHLPQGKSTPDHYVYALTLKGEDAPIGCLWWGIHKHGSKKVAWIFDIELQPEFRGQGLGRAAMELAQSDVKSKGFQRLGLHVFGHNKAAHSLYQSLGFEPTNVVMYKNL